MRTLYEQTNRQSPMIILYHKLLNLSSIIISSMRIFSIPRLQRANGGNKIKSYGLTKKRKSRCDIFYRRIYVNMKTSAIKIVLVFVHERTYMNLKKEYIISGVVSYKCPHCDAHIGVMDLVTGKTDTGFEQWAYCPFCSFDIDSY